MSPPRIPVPQVVLSAAAASAALAYGAPWLGLDWVYTIEVNSASFQVGAGFPLGLLAAVLMGLGAGLTPLAQRARLGALMLGLGGAAIFGSALWMLLVWAPSGAAPGFLELLRDATRLGFALLALGLPFALAHAPPVARATALLLGAVLAPVLLFPASVEAAGVTDARSTLPMTLFALLALAPLAGGMRWSLPRKRAAPREAEAAWMRAWQGPRQGKARGKGKARGVRMEGLRALAMPEGPQGPDRPRPPMPQQARRPPSWFYQF